MKKKIAVLCLISLCFAITAQEALLSAEEEYYDFLALDGYIERPYLNFRTLSDSQWSVDSDTGTIWDRADSRKTKQITKKINYELYGPDLFNSFNSAAPYGQNDGSLWQGKGLNSSLTGGFRLEGYGFELTVKPQVTFSQNMSFTLMPSTYDSEFGYIWGFGQNIGVDAPQRFGDKSYFDFSWGDSEIRYTWKTLTIGFGTQSPWIGSGHVNSLLHSNNAAPYPKVDFGIRKTQIHIRGWYAGDIEARLWLGYLSESEYFDNIDSNDHNLLTGLSVAFTPKILPGLMLFVNRTFLTKWGSDNLSYIAELFIISGVQENEDQRASLGFSYLVPNGGIEVYGEAGIDDYSSLETGYLFHSIAYTGGLRKSVALKTKTNMRGEFTFEWTNLELSQDFQFQWPSTFYGHSQITQGYTNEGQWLGAGIGTGGNCQFAGFKIYYPKGFHNIFIYRVNPDNDFLYKNTIQTTLSSSANNGTASDFYRFKASFSIGIQSMYFLRKNLSINGGLVYNLIINQNYIKGNDVNNFRVEFGLKNIL